MTASNSIGVEEIPGQISGEIPGEIPASLLQLRLQVSLNEEHVYLGIMFEGGQTLDLGERQHHHCLLTLARQRLSDAQRGIVPGSQGWLERQQLARMLGLDPGNLTIQLHRLRQQIARALPIGIQLDEVVERRRGELRIGTLPFCIVRGSIVEGEFIVPRQAG
ncbi:MULTISPECIES: hypothetical protein [unclassified Janthinobacterium]|uniref:hypothetical protein n=1 Tax=unclassified Janthinobacterium TaxID=2610881 RepID=UPI00160AAB9D|nr:MULTISPECIES: hypothetical protein [unclassified Janthinobacterium]MBB5371379.1 hypothetical protein [Janthinobacterium sp. K2C7]MBB5384185.1 hypothetical protein [Janthinobacterium sp. K2Li3]MBB5389355.1 hypothetical protein [Janthinobacterium sp. K2E3]